MLIEIDDENGKEILSQLAEQDAAGETYRNRFARDVFEWRHIGPEYNTKPCDGCGGSGYKLYGNTSTWRYGIGGSAMTTDVCDRCWGSGTDKPWPSHRETYAIKPPQGDVVLVPRALAEKAIMVLDVEGFDDEADELRALLCQREES